MTRRIVAPLSALALSALVLAGSAVIAGGDRTHRVAPGESASSIAAHYYADHELADALLGYNGKSDTLIHAGESLKIPVCDEHVVEGGDTWSALTRRYLGRADGWPAVASLNGLSPDAPLLVGQRLVFPVVLDHALGPGETLAVLAQRFYGDPKRSSVLGRFNAIDDPRRLSVGQTVKIPLVVFRVPSDQAPTPAPTPAAPPVAALQSVPVPVPVPPAPRFADELRSVTLALVQGEFDEAADRIEAVREDVSRAGTATEQVELWRLLALVSVARGDDQRACQAYHALIDVQADWTPDPDLVSPKVRNALGRCS